MKQIILTIIVVIIGSSISGVITGNYAKRAVYRSDNATKIEQFFSRVCPSDSYIFRNSTTTEMIVECLDKDMKKVNFKSQF